jgi:hypothetical protein
VQAVKSRVQTDENSAQVSGDTERTSCRIAGKTGSSNTLSALQQFN